MMKPFLSPHITLPSILSNKPKYTMYCTVQALREQKLNQTPNLTHKLWKKLQFFDLEPMLGCIVQRCVPGVIIFAIVIRTEELVILLWIGERGLHFRRPSQQRRVIAVARHLPFDRLATVLKVFLHLGGGLRHAFHGHLVTFDTLNWCKILNVCKAKGLSIR